MLQLTYNMFKRRKTAVKICFVGLICLLLVCCSKKEAGNDYGVSVSAPNVIGTIAEQFSQEQLSLFKMANSLGISAAKQFSKSDSSAGNLAFSYLLLLDRLYNEASDTAYLKCLSQFYKIDNLSLERVRENFASVFQIISSIDSSLVMQSSFDTSDDGSALLVQRFSLSLPFEDALRSHSDYFSDENLKKSRRNFFTLSGSFDCAASSEEIVSAIPIGNGNYRLMFVMPLQKSLRDYASDFSEAKYVELCERLEKRKIGLEIPTFENFVSETRIELPQMSCDSVVVVNAAVQILSHIEINPPSEAQLKVETSSMEEKIIRQTKNEERISFNRPFLFILYGANSRAILLQGLYLH